MTALCGWLPSRGPVEGETVAAMGRALRSDPRQSWAAWTAGRLSVGLLELDGREDYSPAVTPDGRYFLWMAGEAFAARSMDVPGVDETRTVGFRRGLLDRLVRHGADGLRDLDGEYQIVLWDAVEKALVLVNDRFGGLPLYYAQSREGFAFAGGVRGVLMAPGVRLEPDVTALREVVTFGGFRLGSRTNVASVKMLPGASAVTVRDGAPTFRRYWRWHDVKPVPARPLPELIEALDPLWKAAVGRRLRGARRPGQTLSGGLDSRAILAEAAPSAPHWTAITYGVPGCDDARYAERAAETVGAHWVFHPLYGGREPDWLDVRTGYVQDTDGLIELGDLTHIEALSLQAELLDVHLSGYVGDAVSGPTFLDVVSTEDVVQSLPYYGTSLGLSYGDAVARATELVAQLDGAPARYALFDNKLPQSTNRWSAAWRPWLRVRKPFVDYAFFDFCQGLPPAVRARGRLHEAWLLSRYPHLFRAIPNQKTGMPVGTPAWRVFLERARRFGWRKIQPLLARSGLPARPRLRAYRDDERYWRTPLVRERIEQVILRPESIAVEAFGRDPVTGVLSDWFERGAAPAQVIGALYVFEAYHRDLPRHLRGARTNECFRGPRQLRRVPPIQL